MWHIVFHIYNSIFFLFLTMALNWHFSLPCSDPVRPAVPPAWVVEPSSANVALGGTVALHCLAKGFPNPTVVWRKETGKLFKELCCALFQWGGLLKRLLRCFIMKVRLSWWVVLHVLFPFFGICRSLSQTVRLSLKIFTLLFLFFLNSISCFILTLAFHRSTSPFLKHACDYVTKVDPIGPGYEDTFFNLFKPLLMQLY